MFKNNNAEKRFNEKIMPFNLKPQRTPSQSDPNDRLKLLEEQRATERKQLQREREARWKEREEKLQAEVEERKQREHEIEEKRKKAAEERQVIREQAQKIRVGSDDTSYTIHT
jgi:hypothetical protein